MSMDRLRLRSRTIVRQSRKLFAAGQMSGSRDICERNQSVSGHADTPTRTHRTKSDQRVARVGQRDWPIGNGTNKLQAFCVIIGTQRGIVLAQFIYQSMWNWAQIIISLTHTHRPPDRQPIMKRTNHNQNMVCCNRITITKINYLADW